MATTLIRPLEYQRSREQLFRTYSAFRRYLGERDQNGLLQCGAVVESPLGLLVDPDKFDEWLQGRALHRGALRKLARGKV